MKLIAQALLPATLMASLVAAFFFASSKPAIVEVAEELPVREALDRAEKSNPRADFLAESDVDDSTNSYGNSDVADVPQPDSDVIETMAKFDKFSIFVDAVEAVGLAKELESAEGVTVFAPTNRAFIQLPEEVVEDLFKAKNRALLKRFISAHIVPRRVVWSDLFGRRTRLRTIGGTSIAADGSLGVRVNGTKLRLSDVLATNGVVHVVDELVGIAEADSPTM